MKCHFCHKEYQLVHWLKKHFLRCEAIETIILDFVHTETGWGNPLLPHCECEEITIESVKELPANKFRIDFKYHFDEDGWSQYDKTHVFKGSLVINSTGKISDKKLIEKHKGIAANYVFEAKS